MPIIPSFLAPYDPYTAQRRLFEQSAQLFRQSYADLGLPSIFGPGTEGQASKTFRLLNLKHLRDRFSQSA